MNRSPLVALLALLLAVGSIASCSVARYMEGEPGTDLGRVSAGATQQEIEAVLGTPSREWQTSLGIRYRLYSYDAGAPPSTDDASAMVFLGVISAGFSEVVIAASTAAGERAFLPVHVRRFLAVSFGNDGRAIGIFPGLTEFSVLPEDGRPAAEGTVGISKPP